MPAQTKYRLNNNTVMMRHTLVSHTYPQFNYDYVNSFTSTFSDQRTGINNPKWREQVKRGQSATTDCSGIKLMRSPTDGYCTIVSHADGNFNGDFVYSLDGTIGPVETLSGFTSSNQAAEQIALLQVYKRLRENHQKFSGMTFLGELRQAKAMVKRPAETLFKSIGSYIDTLKKRQKGISKSSKRGKLARKKILADTWLEYSFGWIPLVSDVGSAAKALAAWHVGIDGTDERRQLITGRGEALTPEINSTQSADYNITYLSIPMKIRSVGVRKEEVRYKVGLSYNTAVPKESASRLLELSGFTLAEFVPTAWELLPWSFLIDYFTNIGDVLEAFSTPKENIRWILKTVRTTDICNRSYHVDVQTLFTRYGVYVVLQQEAPNGTSNWSTLQTSFQRFAVSGLDLPRFELENPFGKNAKNRAFNILALAAGAKSLKPYY